CCVSSRAQVDPRSNPALYPLSLHDALPIYVSFTLNKDDKVAFVGRDDIAKTTLFKILMGEMEPDAGSFKWGITTSQSYFPKDNSEYFDKDLTLVDWLRQYASPDEQ